MTEILSYISRPLSTECSRPTPIAYNPNTSLLNSLLIFYSDPNNIKQLYLLISGEDKISLRLLEWTVLNYAKNEGLVINNGTTDRFSVYSNYKATLSGYSKEQYDPCCRTERISIPYLDKLLKTTIAQLNFIRWIIKNKILDYIRVNYSIITKDMQKRSKKTVKNIPASALNSDLTNDGKKNEMKTRKRRTDSTSLSHTVKNFKIELCPTTLNFGI